MTYVIKDDELEHALLRNTELFQQYLTDNRSYNERQATKMFTDEEVEKYADIFPDKRLGTRRSKIIAFLKVHPELKSSSPEIIHQRITLYYKNYDAASHTIEPKRDTPIQDTISQFE